MASWAFLPVGSPRPRWWSPRIGELSHKVSGTPPSRLQTPSHGIQLSAGQRGDAQWTVTHNPPFYTFFARWPLVHSVTLDLIFLLPPLQNP